MRRIAALACHGAVLAAAMAVPAPAGADCRCRALGTEFTLGELACVPTPQGLRLATCGMVLNNTSWQVSDRQCTPLQISAAERAKAPPSHRLGRGHSGG
jgi:hypothetical protein